MSMTPANGARAADEARGLGGDPPPLAPRSTLSADAVARMFDVSIFQLWLYEWLGLIRREHTDGSWGYSWAHCERIALIARARAAGLRLRDLKPIVMAMDDAASPAAVDQGKTQALDLIRILETSKGVHDKALQELYRVDWEVSQRLVGFPGDMIATRRSEPKSEPKSKR